MPWIMLVVSGMLEAVWIIVLPRSGGFTKIIPTPVFLFRAIVSMGGLAYALRTILVDIGYVAWVDIGTGTIVTWAFTIGVETVPTLKVPFILGTAACVIGLKSVSD